MKKADFITGFLLLILSGNVIFRAWRMPVSGSFAPGSGFFPMWLGTVVILAIVLLIKAARLLPGPSQSSLFPTGKALLSVVAVFSGLAFYIVLMETIGFLVNTFMFVTFLMKTVERENWRLTVIVAVLTTAALYIVFQVLLGITLPKNQFGF